MLRRLSLPAVVLLAVSVVVVTASAQKEQPPRAVRWDHKVVGWSAMTALGGYDRNANPAPPTEPAIEKAMNKLGEDGWELIQAPEVNKAGPFYFKRQK